MQKATARTVKALEGFIFWSRWLQAPLYLGLIVAQGVYVYQFMHELAVLVTRAGSLSEANEYYATMSAPAFRARPMLSMILSRLPARSPTVGLIWAREIRMVRMELL